MKWLVLAFTFGYTWTTHSETSIVVRELVDEKSFRAQSSDDKIRVNDRFSIHSLASDEIVGLAQVVRKENNAYSQLDIYFKVLSILDHQLVIPGQALKPLKLASTNLNYPGKTQLLLKSAERAASSKFRPLYTQGVLVGDTAETLDKNEFLGTYLGQLYYGLYDNVSVGTTAPVNAAGGLNFFSKFRMYSSHNTTLSTLLSFTRVPESTQSNLNITFLWDSYSNDTMITHNFLSLAVLAWDKADETTAIKSFGSSSIQTGYEFILKDWDRILIGPNYNFEKKTIGGYFSYVAIWDRLHWHLSLNTIDIRSKKWSYSDGYYAFMDIYWRY